MNFDDVEHFLEGILAGLKARKEIEPLREKVSELEGKITSLVGERDNLAAENKSLLQQVDRLTDERNDFENQLETAQNDFNRREENLREEFNREFDKGKQRILDMQEDFREKLAEQSDDFNRQLAELQAELNAADKARRAAETTAKFYRETYSELDDAYKIYSTLDNDTRFELAGIFGAGDNAAGFFSGAIQESHLASFWDYVSRHPEDNLVRLFDFCFEMVNRGFREPPYARLDIEVDDYFDADLMRRTSQSRQMGKVSRVALQGYRYLQGSVVKKSVVELA